MTPQDMDLLAKLVAERSGLVLSPQKSYLVESRLAPLARKEGFGGLDELITAVRMRRDERLAWAVTEAMTTNETFFFRDKTPFDLFMNDALPALRASRKPGDPLRIWCAACSSGQEPYSLAMLMDQNPGALGGMRPEIVATDICSKALEKAEAGVYSQFEVQRGLPVQMLVKYFEKADEAWRIDPGLKRTITYKRFNLLDGFAAMGRFDVVFCRNVLIYFDQERKRDVLARMAQQSRSDAFLFLGAAETVMGLSDNYKSVPGKRGLYRREAAQAKAA